MFKCGFISINGKANVGKSTLTNRLVGEKVSIVSWKAHTTRDNILGIVNGDDYQAIFIDTPGLHTAKNKLDSYMMKSARTAMKDVDVLLYVIDSQARPDPYDKEFVEMHANKEYPLIVVLNKDDVAGPEKILSQIDRLKDIEGIKAIVPISAIKGDGIDELLHEIVKYLPEGDPLYDRDEVSDKDLAYMMREIVREKTLRLLDKEVPYGIGVSLQKFRKRENQDIYDIEGTIYCEKENHKGIIIGKNGSMLKKISTYSRQDIEDMLGTKVYLKLWVKVKPDWREDVATLEKLGYSNKSNE